jgi:hypothetical protein
MLARSLNGQAEIGFRAGHKALHASAECLNKISYPLVGEVPAPLVAGDSRFWLNVDLESVPVQYRFEEFPPHYHSLPVLYASFRKCAGLPDQGTWASRKLRKMGLTPGMLDSLPLKQQPIKLVFPSAHISTAFRNLGSCFTNVMSLLQIVEIEELMFLNNVAEEAQEIASQRGMPTPLHMFQVLPRRLSYNSVNGELQGVTLMNCPSRRIVESHVPIVAINGEESPTAKKGGFPLVIKKTIPVRSLATNIPLQVTIDCAKFEFHDRVFLRDLRLAPGQVIVGMDPDTCLVKMAVGNL